MAGEEGVESLIDMRAPEHEHGWTTESTHRTSEGVIAYVGCVSCGARRVDMRDDPGMPAYAQSVVVSRRMRAR